MEVRYRELGLDEVLRQEDQFLAKDEGIYEDYWQLIKPDSIGFTPRRFAAFGTRWRRPFFASDWEFALLPTEAESKTRGWQDASN